MENNHKGIVLHQNSSLTLLIVMTTETPQSQEEPETETIAPSEDEKLTKLPKIRKTSKVR